MASNAIFTILGRPKGTKKAWSQNARAHTHARAQMGFNTSMGNGYAAINLPVGVAARRRRRGAAVVSCCVVHLGSSKGGG